MTNTNRIEQIEWVGSKGQKIELRAYCNTTMKNRTANLDGDIVILGQEPTTDANLELWVDGKKIDSCWDINFWEIINAQAGIKKIWGLKVGMSDEQAVIVKAFLNEVIESGKSEDVKNYEDAKANAEKATKKTEAQKTIDKAAKQTKPLMTNAEYKVWAKNYNDINNEGGEGYIPELITVEQLEQAKRVMAE